MWNERSDDHFKKSFLPHSIGLYFISIGGKQNELALYRGNSNLGKQLIDKMLWSCDIGGEGAQFCEFLKQINQNVVNDMTGTAEATIYEEKATREKLCLPKFGESVIVLGEGRKKEFKGDKTMPHVLLKIKVERFKVISLDEEFLIHEKTILSQRKRLGKNNGVDKDAGKKKIPLMRELRASLNPVEIRTLVLCCLYLTLENNADLNSYTFTSITIRKHRLTKNFLEEKGLRQECIDYMGEFIEGAIEYLSQKNFIEEKGVIQSRKVFKADRKLFFQIEIQTLANIFDNKDQGSKSSDIVYGVNHRFGLHQEKNFAFNEDLIHRILKKFIQEGKIYKTNDKLIYPHFL